MVSILLTTVGLENTPTKFDVGARQYNYNKDNERTTMLDKAFGMKQVTEDITQDPMVMYAGYLVMEAETEDERNHALNVFGQTITGLMAYAMSELLLSEEDFTALTATIGELIEIGEVGEED